MKKVTVPERVAQRRRGNRLPVAANVAADSCFQQDILDLMRMGGTA